MTSLTKHKKLGCGHLSGNIISSSLFMEKAGQSFVYMAGILTALATSISYTFLKDSLSKKTSLPFPSSRFTEVPVTRSLSSGLKQQSVLGSDTWYQMNQQWLKVAWTQQRYTDCTLFNCTPAILWGKKMIYCDTSDIKAYIGKKEVNPVATWRGFLKLRMSQVFRVSSPANTHRIKLKEWKITG